MASRFHQWLHFPRRKPISSARKEVGRRRERKERRQQEREEGRRESGKGSRNRQKEEKTLKAKVTAEMPRKEGRGGGNRPHSSTSPPHNTSRISCCPCALLILPFPPHLPLFPVWLLRPLEWGGGHITFPRRMNQREMAQTSGEGEGKPSKSQAKRGSHGGDCEADGAKRLSVRGDRHLEKLLLWAHVCGHAPTCVCTCVYMCTEISEIYGRKEKERGLGGARVVVFRFKYVVFSSVCGCVFACFQVSVCEWVWVLIPSASIPV